MRDKSIRNDGRFRNNLLRFYSMENKNQSDFLLKVDWLLENAVFPLDGGYAENLADLWNVYMPNYPFDKVVLEYSKNCYSVLRYVHDGELFKFNSVKIMQEAVIKNYLKYLISQGAKTRIELVKKSFALLKDTNDRAKLYDLINSVIDLYFPTGEINQNDCMFLNRFQDFSEQPFKDILERLTDIHDQKEQEITARKSLVKELRINEGLEEQFLTLINILLCKLAAASGEKRFSDTLRDTWQETMSSVKYDDVIYSFIEKFEKPYMTAACYGIPNIGNGEIVRLLYKDSIILCAALEAFEKGNCFGIRDVNEYWKRDGMHFANRFFFDDEYERMKNGFNPEIIIQNKNSILRFHELLIEKIKDGDFSVRSTGGLSRERKSASLEMNNVAISEKERQIEQLQDRISEFEEKMDNAELEVMSQFISLLDSKKYDHVLGKLYRTAYTSEELRIEDIRTVLKNLFEIMNISGIDICGEIDIVVSGEEVKRGRYRLDDCVKDELFVKYPGYKIGNSVILHPLVEGV